jgi:hypothetical protein
MSSEGVEREREREREREEDVRNISIITQTVN